MESLSHADGHTEKEKGERKRGAGIKWSLSELEANDSKASFGVIGAVKTLIASPSSCTRRWIQGEMSTAAGSLYGENMWE
jgi:hypothetical protein